MTPNHPFRTLAILLSLASATAGAAQLAESDSQPPATLEIALEAASGRFAGVLAVAGSGLPPSYAVHAGADGAGWRTAYPLASVTKVFTSTAVLALHEQGRLDLDAPLDTLLPAFAGQPAAKVNVRQLLGHSSGIPSVMQSGQGLDDTLDLATWPQPSSLDAQLARIVALPLRFAPGTRYSYNNSGYLILAKVLESITGKPYSQAIAELALAPAGVAAQACFCSDLADAADVAPREWDGGATKAAVAVHPTRSASAGGLRMTPGALMRWLRALVAGRILKPETLALAWRPGLPTRRTGESMGLGWLVRTAGGRTVVLHDGALPGAAATVAIDPAAKTVALGLLSPTLPLAQLSTSEDYLRERVVALVAGERPDALPRAASRPLPSIADDYALPDGRTLRVALKDGDWTVSVAGGGSPLEVRQAVRLASPLAGRAAGAAAALVDGGQQALLPHLSDALKAQLPPTALDGFVAAWKAEHGAFRSAHAFAANAQGTSVRLRLQFERGAVDVGFNYVDGKLDGLQLLGGSRPDLPATLEGWAAEQDSLWLDGYRFGAEPLRLFAVVEDGAVTGLALDPAHPQGSAFPRRR